MIQRQSQGLDLVCIEIHVDLSVQPAPHIEGGHAGKTLDAVLDLIVGEYLFRKFEKSDEGILSKIRASLVNERGFTMIARAIKLGEYIYISAAEENNNGRDKSSLLSNAFEAVIGAIYLEAGLEKAREISVALIEECHPKIDLDSLSKDFKTALAKEGKKQHSLTEYF